VDTDRIVVRISRNIKGDPIRISDGSDVDDGRVIDGTPTAASRA